MPNDTTDTSDSQEKPFVPPHLSFWRILGLSMNSFAGYPWGVVMGLKFPIFNILLGVSPWLISIGQAISVFADAITDPLMGRISDNTRTRWGRRRPYILLGGVLIAITANTYYLCELGWSMWAYFLWFTLFTVLIRTVQTVNFVPAAALSIEVVYDYDSRTRISAYRAYIGTVLGLGTPWFFRFAQFFKYPENGITTAKFFYLPESTWGWMERLFSAQLYGARVLMLLISILVVAGAVIMFMASKGFERLDLTPGRVDAKKKEAQKGSIYKDIASLWKIPVFRKKIISATIGWWTDGFFNVMGFYMSIYYVCLGDVTLGATIAGVTGLIGTVKSFVFLPLAHWSLKHFEKHHVIYVSTAWTILFVFLRWYLLTPEAPWLQLWLALGTFSTVFSGLAYGAANADFVDEDEYVNGGRREGVISAVFSWFAKMGAVLSLIVAGFILEFTGFEIKETTALLNELKAGTIDETGKRILDVMFMKMRILYCILPGILSVVALWVFYGYQLTRERCEFLKKELEVGRRGLPAEIGTAPFRRG